MISKTITDSDMIILQSVESYLKNLGAPRSNYPQEQLIITQQARDFLYSDIVQRVPRVASYILGADMETDTVAQGLYMALSKHAMDPVFINILMQYLSKINNPEENGAVGAMLAKILNKCIESKMAESNKVPSKKEKGADAIKDEKKPDMSDIDHLKRAVEYLLGNLAKIICVRCGNLSEVESYSIAACIAMNNKDTIDEIIASNLPITAQLFDIVEDPSNLITSALLLKKSDMPKLTPNQTAFIDSLKRWVYGKLNDIPTHSSYRFLVATYKSVKPQDVSKYLIQIKDCGTQYSNLLTVAKQLINQ